MTVFFGIFICVFIYLIFMNVRRFIENENSPILTEQATVVRRYVDSHTDANGMMHSTSVLVFSTAQGEIRCMVRHGAYRDIPEGAEGMLTHQGTRFYQFVFDGVTVVK